MKNSEGRALTPKSVGNAASGRTTGAKVTPFDGLSALGYAVRGAREDLTEHVKPRDETEQAIVGALGNCSWDECVAAIQKLRSGNP